MPVDDYGFVKGSILAWKPPGADDRQAELRLQDEDGCLFRVAIDVVSKAKGSELVYWLSRRYEQPQLLARLSEASQGLHTRDFQALDLFRGNLVELDSSVILHHHLDDMGGQSLVFLDEVSDTVENAIAKGAVAYVWGSVHMHAGKWFIHNVHMNQGSRGTFRAENGVAQDGAMLLEFPDGHWEALFIAFVSQSIITDNVGQPVGSSLQDYHMVIMGLDNGGTAISSRTKRCQGLFQDCQQYRTLSVGDFIDKISAQFYWWSLGIGAAKTGRSSLDHRVRMREDVRGVLIGLLDSLEISLLNCIEIARLWQAAKEDTTEVAQVEVFNPEMDLAKMKAEPQDQSEPDDLRSKVANPSLRPQPEIFTETTYGTQLPDDDSRLGEQFTYMRASVDYLARISAAIQQSGSKARHERADKLLAQMENGLAEFKTFLRHLVLVGPVEISMFNWTLFRNPQAEVETTKAPSPGKMWRFLTRGSRLNAVQERLIEANVVRRNRFNVYFEEYLRKTKKREGVPVPRATTDRPVTTNPTTVPRKDSPPAPGPDQTQSIDPRPEVQPPPPQERTAPLRTLQSSRTATELAPDFTLPKRPAVQETNSVVTTPVSHGTLKQDYPKCPAQNGERFWCPFCAQLLDNTYSNPKKDKKWRGHVAEDLLPYVCVYADCNVPITEAMFASTDDWQRHLKKHHSVTCWVCDACWLESRSPSQFEFEDEMEWRLHLTAHHQTEFKESDLPAIAEESQRTTLPRIPCPLCFGETTPMQPGVDKHIAEHIHSFALQALPWETISTARSSKASAGSHAGEFLYREEYENSADESDWDESHDLPSLINFVADRCEALFSTEELYSANLASTEARGSSFTEYAMAGHLRNISRMRRELSLRRKLRKLSLRYQNYDSDINGEIAASLARLKSMLLSRGHDIAATDVDAELELLDSFVKLAESRLLKPISGTEHVYTENNLYSFDLLNRRHRHFVLWLPSTGPNWRAPQLIIGTYSGGSFKQLAHMPLAQSEQHPELWELSPADLAPPLSDGVYHYWFEVQDTRDQQWREDGAVFVTDPFAYTVDPRIDQRPIGSWPQPASVIRYRDGRLWPCDLDGTEQRRVRTQSPTSLPPNNHLVMYELPVSWTRVGADEQGNKIGVGTFADVQALFDETLARSPVAMPATLKSLGINGLQLCPVSDSAKRGGWGYAAANYFAADAHLGSASDLCRLVECLESCGVRLFTDMVISFGFDSYSLADFPAFHIEPSREPSNPDSYKAGTPGDLREGFGGHLWRFVTTMTGSAYDPETGKRMNGVVPARAFHQAHLARWMTDFGIRGLRLDAVENTGSWDFLREYRRTAWDLYRAREDGQGNDASKFLVVGDGDSSGMLAGDDTTKCLDALWNHPWQMRLRAVILGKGTGGEDFEATLRKLVDCRLDRDMEFYDGAQAVNYITSHDVEGYGRERLCAFLWNHGVGSRDSPSETERRAMLAFVCLLTSVGIPMILSGEEFCEEHDRDMHNKQVDPVDWERLLDDGRYRWRRRLFDYVANLVRFRTACPALGENDTDILHIDQSGGRKVVAWRRGGGRTSPVVVVANFSDKATPGEYIVPNWPGQEMRPWREVTQNREVPWEWVGREALERWEAKVYVVG